MDLPDLVTCVIRESGLEKTFKTGRGDEDMARLENLDELVTAAAEWVSSIQDLEVAAAIPGCRRHPAGSPCMPRIPLVLCTI